MTDKSLSMNPAVGTSWQPMEGLMLQTVPSAVERSYQLLALLDVCDHSARYIAADLAPGHVARAAGSLANALELASEIASELHDFLEVGDRRVKAATLHELADGMRSQEGASCEPK